MIMKQTFFAVGIVLVLGAGLSTLVAQRQGAPAPAPAAPPQNPSGQQPPPTADPYANNAKPGTTEFPLAAPAGKDSNARMVAPPGAVNQGAFDPASWKFGPAFDPPAG